MAKGDRDSKSPSGITYRRRIGPDGKSYNFNVPPEEKKAKPKVKAKPPEPKVEAPADPKRGQEQRFRPAPKPEVPAKPERGQEQRFRPAPPPTEDNGKPVKRPIRPGQEDSGPGFNIGPFRIDKGYSPEHPGKPIWGIGYKGFKSGGSIRGDGMSRVSTKGKVC